MLTLDDLQQPAPDVCLTILKARLLDRMRAHNAATGETCCATRPRAGKSKHAGALTL